MATKKARKSSSKPDKCKVVTNCGKRRRICWKNGKIVSNQPATRKKAS
jgi:hypothetical protein